VTNIGPVCGSVIHYDYYLETGTATCPPESDAAANLDQVRLHIITTDTTAKTALDIFTVIWDHVLDKWT